MPDGGYVWWYLDALSDDGLHGITIIAFIGSVFSPYYAWARRRGNADPERFCAVNVALYGRNRRWCMTERGADTLDRGRDWLAIGPSGLHWDGNGLTVRIDEIAAPLPRRVRGVVRLFPSAVETRIWRLDACGRHLWSPIAPSTRVEVALEAPSLSWSGPGYFDTNCGSRPLEADFRRWDWSRTALPGGTFIQYDVTPLAPGPERRLALRYAAAGGVEEVSLLDRVALPRTRWQLERATGAGQGQRPLVRATLEDTPFYARSMLEDCFFGTQAAAMHESLSLDRFRAPWVQAMLPFRIPRELWSGRRVAAR